MDDPMRLEKFNHNCSWDLKVESSNLRGMCQNFDFFLVLALEGKVEIFEFPVVMIDVKTMEVAHFFHRFNLPSYYHQKSTLRSSSFYFLHFFFFFTISDCFSFNFGSFLPEFFICFFDFTKFIGSVGGDNEF